jgi:hypothetical protein
MKSLIAVVMLAFASASFAQGAKQPEGIKAPEKKETNCVKKDKDGKCPPAPKGEKPTPKKKAESEPVKK